LIEFVGCENISIKKNKLYFTNEFTKIDLGGFVKEYSVDRAVKIIKKYKIKSALINFGGDIFAIGKKPNGSKYSIGVTNPQNKNEFLFTVDIENQALTTSASYERNTIVENVEYSHIIKRENKSDILSATVVSHSCLNSGVYATSLMCDTSINNLNETYLINKDLEVIR
jgi:thiamine biosynthesis lipoprotein